jgi:hypothetical protein
MSEVASLKLKLIFSFPVLIFKNSAASIGLTYIDVFTTCKGCRIAPEINPERPPFTKRTAVL